MDDIVIYAAGEIRWEWRAELRGHLDPAGVVAEVEELDALATLTVETLEQAAQAVAYIFE